MPSREITQLHDESFVPIHDAASEAQIHGSADIPLYLPARMDHSATYAAEAPVTRADKSEVPHHIKMRRAIVGGMLGGVIIAGAGMVAQQVAERWDIAEINMKQEAEKDAETDAKAKDFLKRDGAIDRITEIVKSDK